MKTAIFNGPYADGPGAIRWIVASWAEGFRRRGYEFSTCDDPSRLKAQIEANPPTILYCDIVATPIENPAFREVLSQARKRGTKIALNVFWPLFAQPPARAQALIDHDVADLYCGEREPDSMEAFERDTGKRYVTMPQSANPLYHFPGPYSKRFAYDVVFLGAKLPHKRWFNENIIGALQKRFNVGVFGTGWTLRDNSLRALSKASRMMHCRPLARTFDKFRFAVSDADENSLYASAKISVNFHEREPDNSQPHHIVNQRTFKIAACGGFQLIDPVKGLPKYFNSDEIVTAGFSSEEWVQKVEYYLTHEAERKAIQERATARALREHMAPNRVDLMEKLLGISGGA